MKFYLIDVRMYPVLVSFSFSERSNKGRCDVPRITQKCKRNMIKRKENNDVNVFNLFPSLAQLNRHQISGKNNGISMIIIFN